MLQNAYFLAKIGADTAENEQHFPEILPKTVNGDSGRGRPRAKEAEGGRGRARRGVDGGGRGGEGPRLRVAGLGVEVGGRVSKIGKLLQIFGGLVLGCIKTKFCKKIRV